jgi:polyphosphate kinase 2 (PPK2 family)
MIVKQQARLNSLMENNEKKIAVILEGRDTAGKSSTIRELTHYLSPDWYSIVPSKKPTASAMRNWLSYWQSKLPTKPQIVFYDRSWYSRAMVQYLNGWCSKFQYKNFLKNISAWEKRQDVIIIKFWLSISKTEQAIRIANRKNSKLTGWKFSENDEKSLAQYDRMSELQKRVVDSSWQKINYNNKESGKLELITKLCETLEKSL